MSSRGVIVYSYVIGYKVEFALPKDFIRNTAADNSTSKDLEVDPSNVEGVVNYSCSF